MFLIQFWKGPCHAWWYLSTVWGIEDLLNTSMVSPFSGSFCDIKGTIVRLKTILTVTNTKRFFSRAIMVWLKLADLTGTATPWCEQVSKEVRRYWYPKEVIRGVTITLLWKNLSVPGLNPESCMLGKLCICKRVLYFMPSGWAYFMPPSMWP